MSVDLLSFPKPLLANGSENWGDCAAALIENGGWRELPLGIHELAAHVGGRVASMSVIVMTDGRGILRPSEAMFGVSPDGRQHAGVYISQESPLVPIVGTSSEQGFALMAVARWRAGYPRA